MSFSARIEADIVSVEAGATVPISIEVECRSENGDRFEVQIEGLDPEWTAVPVPVFAVAPGEKHTEKLFFKPPRASESLAGNYPFVVRVRSLESGEAKTVQSVLQIKPFHHLSIELNPKRGVVSTFRNQNEFHVTLMNLGNTEHTLQLYGNDPDEALVFEFEQEQVTVAPGQQKTVEVYVDPTSRRLFSSGRLYMFSISARSIEQPSIVTSSQAQLEQRPLLSPFTLAGVVLLMAVLALWVYMLPKPPTFDGFRILPDKASPGQDIVISWDTSNAKKVNVAVSGRPIPQDFAPDDKFTYRFIEPGTYQIEVFAEGENKVVKRTSAVEVVLPPEPDTPVVAKFEISPRELKLNDTFVVTYQVSNATKIRLEPTGVDLDVNGSQQEFKAERTGRITYTLIAINGTGPTAKKVQKTISINVTDPTMPKVSSFEVSPKTLPPGGGTVTITWQLSNTVSQQLKIGNEPPVDIETSASQSVDVTATTKITITGRDSQGRTVTKTTTITVEAEPPPDTTGATTGGDQTTGTSTTGTTGGTTTGGGG